MTPRIYRVQSSDGRGPFSPGLTVRWIADGRYESRTPIFEELPNCADIVAKAHSKGLHLGCATRGGDAFKNWFCGDEISRLQSLGFYPVRASQCTVLAETPTQLLIAWQKPLKGLTRCKWAECLNTNRVEALA